MQGSHLLLVFDFIFWQGHLEGSTRAQVHLVSLPPVDRNVVFLTSGQSDRLLSILNVWFHAYFLFAQKEWSKLVFYFPVLHPLDFIIGFSLMKMEYRLVFHYFFYLCFQEGEHGLTFKWCKPLHSDWFASYVTHDTANTLESLLFFIIKDLSVGGSRGCIGRGQWGKEGRSRQVSAGPWDGWSGANKWKCLESLSLCYDESECRE